MEQTIWTYRDPASTQTFDTKGIKNFITNYLNGPAKRPLMIWCHNNPSIEQLQEYLENYRREDGTKLFSLGSSVTVTGMVSRYVLVDGKVKDLKDNYSEYPDNAFLPYAPCGKFFGFFYFDYGFVTNNQFGEKFSRALGLFKYYRMPAVFLVNDWGAFNVKDQVPRQAFDHIRYLPTVKEFIEDAKRTLETKNMNSLGRYVYSNVIEIAEGFIKDDEYAFYFEQLIDAVFNILEKDNPLGSLQDTYKDGPLAVTQAMNIIFFNEADPRKLFCKKFQSALQASKLAWMFDSSQPIPEEIAEFVGKDLV